ncbi:alpha/beta hydrolase-fold protein [Neolewinella lacunae]|uniref:Esterase family protein n=1 Tax=Neolewinella lacunae TaxID=1517758 RepID=A0A923PRV5_9BACT|nr:alpha/beta hydrolase-fold protein [Neolewinella lacunae]MBC6996333.1 esterase family protein [Neolewinella lacunae]MDN3636956.1 alpha/beta hydrolase-fold protein [Neolewinella lacunae]
MRHLFFLPLLLVGFLCTCVSAQTANTTGIVYEALSLPSTILGMDRQYAIYLPPGYEQSQRSYPVLYLLHGYGDDQTGWIQFGEVLRITDEAIHSGKATPMIIVMPDANTQRVGYFNSPDGKWRYEDFFFEELMPHVEGKYRIKGQKRFRAIAGLSMGGGGTFTYALHHPELFSSACPLSAWAGGMTVEDVKERFARAGETSYTDTQLSTYHAQHNFVELAKSLDKEKIASVRWFIDCGDDDFLYRENSLVHIALREREIKHEFRIREGGHTWTYWRESLPEVLAFITQAFHQ